MAKVKQTRREKLSGCLKAARVSKHLTQEQAGKLIGQSRYVYGDWERDPDRVPLGQLRLVCLALGVDIAEFVTMK